MKKSTLRTWQSAQVKSRYDSLTGIVLHTTQDLVDLLSIVFAPTKQQPHFTALLLTKSHRLIAWADVTKVRKAGPMIDTHKLLSSVYLTRCYRVVIVHRSPVTTASPPDGEHMLCFKLQMVLGANDAALKDYILWSGTNYFSFEEAGLIMAE